MSSRRSIRGGIVLMALAVQLAGIEAVRAAPAGGTPNEVRVVSVVPDASVRKAPGDWQPLKEGMVLGEGHEVACDPDGQVTLAFADNSKVVVKPTTQVKIASFFTKGGVVHTEILLRIGEVAAQVQKSGAVKSDFKIRSPTATASVRGTEIHRATFTLAKGFSVLLNSGILDLSNKGGTVVTRPHETTKAPYLGEIKDALTVQHEHLATNALPAGITHDETRALQQYTQPVTGDPTSSVSQVTSISNQALQQVAAFRDVLGLFPQVNANVLVVDGLCFDTEDPTIFRAEIDSVLAQARANNYPARFISGLDATTNTLIANQFTPLPLSQSVASALQSSVNDIIAGESAGGVPSATLDTVRVSAQAAINDTVQNGVRCNDVPVTDGLSPSSLSGSQGDTAGSFGSTTPLRLTATGSTLNALSGGTGGAVTIGSLSSVSRVTTIGSTTRSGSTPIGAFIGR